MAIENFRDYIDWDDEDTEQSSEGAGEEFEGDGSRLGAMSAIVDFLGKGDGSSLADIVKLQSLARGQEIDIDSEI